jgi:acetyl-CoA acetyltransferase
MVERFGICRAEQDAFAAESQRRAEHAIAGGYFRDEIVAVEIAKSKEESTPSSMLFAPGRGKGACVARPGNFTEGPSV